MSFSIAALWPGRRVLLCSDRRISWPDGSFQDTEKKIIRLVNGTYIAGVGNPWIYGMLSSYLAGLMSRKIKLSELDLRLKDLKSHLDPCYQHAVTGFVSQFFFLTNTSVILAGNLKKLFIASINWIPAQGNFRTVVLTTPSLFTSCPDQNREIEQYIPRLVEELLDGALDWPAEKFLLKMREVYSKLSEADRTIGNSGDMIILDEAGKAPIELSF